jgi:hypothetical protein
MDQRCRYPKIWAAAFLLIVKAYELVREEGVANRPDNS